MLTRFLCLANLMIVSSTVRRGPYWHLLEVSLHISAHDNHIEAVLRGAASRMGLIDFSTLFDLYASQIAYSVRSSSKDITDISPNLLGFRDKRECAERAFAAFTPMHVLAGDWVLDGRNIFQNHCRIIHKTPHDGLLECLPEIIAYEMVYWASRHDGIRTEEYPDLDTLVKARLEELFETGLFDRYLRQQADGVVTAILRTLGEQDFTPEGPLVMALAVRSESAAQTFQEISALRNRQREDYDPILPAFDVDSVLDALSWFNRRVPYAGDPAITYHVLHRLFSILGGSPLVSEQLRIFNALCLWIACHDDHLKHTTVLHALLNGATNIIGHIDLSRDAQSLLHWTFARLSHGPKDTRLTEILLRIACAAFDSSQSTSKDVAQSGSNILEWVESEAIELIRSRSLRSAVRKALLVWPRECPKQLQDLVGDPTLRDLQNLLSDERISSNKFRMVRQFCRLAEAGLYEEDSFAKRDFWRLKQYIPPPSSLLGDELQAFITLLAHERGQINGLDRDFSNRQAICMRYFTQSRKEPQLEPSMLSRKAIFGSLLAQLEDPSAAQVNLAFRTLRSLVSVTQDDGPRQNGWPSEHHDELQLLGAYVQPHSGRPTVALAQVLQEENSIRLSEDFPRWITFFATSLSDALASRDVFYGPLALILQADPTFAEQVLPILVHIYLHSDAPNANNSPASARDVLSTYFSRLLSYGSSDACHKLLVDVVLHLREWIPPNSRDPLAYDKWLKLDFTILSKNAVACGAYTTALLFLELASEYSDDMEVASQDREEILYQIYSHIDEPDGFYAISTKDVHSLLLKRLHHEKQWDKAFQFHGAALETRSRSVESTNGVMQAFRAFGFDSLAMTTLQSLSGAEGSVDKSMTYDLGWRAGMWDLPQTHGDDDTSVSLYLALRAINRERNPQSADRIIMEQLLQQVDHLKRLGHENLVEIRQVSRTLMCLNEVRQWCHGVVKGKLHPDTAAVYNNEYFSDLTSSKEYDSKF
jgi:serine-protein kinase ATM